MHKYTIHSFEHMWNIVYHWFLSFSYYVCARVVCFMLFSFVFLHCTHFSNVFLFSFFILMSFLHNFVLFVQLCCNEKCMIKKLNSFAFVKFSEFLYFHLNLYLKNWICYVFCFWIVKLYTKTIINLQSKHCFICVFFLNWIENLGRILVKC